MTRFELLQWRELYAAAEQRWAVRTELDDDGTFRLYPLFPADVPAWVEANWDYREYDGGWSLEPA